ncbi:MAG: hypothetical protein M3017_05155 [Actinomycetota bacterium]|nr:hypothetical protein [Actinomycetota bacterium]
MSLHRVDAEANGFDTLTSKLRTELARQRKTLNGVNISLLANSMARIAPDEEPRNKLDELVGPFYGTASLERWLGISRQALDQRVRAKKMLGCMTPDRVRLYPVWQFTDKGTVIPGMDVILPVLASGVDAPWSWALWLVSETEEDLEGMSPAEWLAAGRDVLPVLTLARHDAAVWAA